MDIPPVIPQIQQRPSRFPLWWVLVINCLEFLLAIQFYWMPRGTRIRPMVWAGYVFVLAAFGLGAIPMILPTIRRHPRLIWPWLVLVLSLTPFPLADSIYFHAKKVRGLISEL
jgi:hypothetical protein